MTVPLWDGSIHPQGWVPIETRTGHHWLHSNLSIRSIHPQGWVPIETVERSRVKLRERELCSIHPQGWVPIETRTQRRLRNRLRRLVAFTPKGGCPLKLNSVGCDQRHNLQSSIHPQGWVPIETFRASKARSARARSRSIHPQGWVPIETSRLRRWCRRSRSR